MIVLVLVKINVCVMRHTYYEPLKPKIWGFVLCSQDATRDYETYLVIPRRHLWSQHMSRDPKTCFLITRRAPWPQDMSCVLKTCFAIARHVVWSRRTFWVHKTCLGLTKHNLNTCFVMTTHVLCSHDMSCDHKTHAEFVEEKVDLVGPDIKEGPCYPRVGHNTCTMVIVHVLWP